MALPQEKIFEDEFPLIRSCRALNETRLAQDIHDLTIEVKNGDVLHADRIILAARIPSLRSALSGPLRKENSVLRWPTMPLSLATTFIQYVYTGQVEMTQTNVRGIVTLARMVKLHDLVNWGTTYMAESLNFENLAATWDLARSLNVESLTEKCISLMKAHFEDLVPTDLFVSLPAETLLTLLKSGDLSVDSEEQVIGAIARWVGSGGQDDDEKLNVHAPSMLREVQWQLTTVQCRSRLMESHEIFKKSNECAWLMFQIANWIGASDGDKPPCPFNVRPRQTVFLFGENANEQNTWSVLRFDPQLQKAERVANMNDRRWASYSVVGERIFMIGGENDPRRVDEFLVREGRWRERASLVVGRQWHAAAAVANKNGEEASIGVFGGSFNDGINWTFLSSCEVYDVRQDRWHKLPDLREKRSSLAAVCLPGDSRVFVFGGGNNSLRLASVEFCNLGGDWREKVTSADFWLSAASMRTARWGLAATPFKGKILVAGGCDSEGHTANVVEMFTPPDARSLLGQWTELAGMTEPRSWFTLLAFANAVFALGNCRGRDNTVEALAAPEGSADFDNDLISWIWSSKSSVETLRCIRGAASIHV
ncbi:NudC domain-containing protein 3 [Sparganum proliferum]